MTATTPRTTARPLRPAGPGPALIAAAVLGPLAVAGIRAALPSFTADDSATVAAKAAANPAAQSAVLWLTWLALLTLPLAVLVVSRLAIRTRPALGTAGAVLAWVGFTSLFMIVAVDQVALAGSDPAATASMIDTISALPAVSMATTVFVVGHILGTVLLAIALWGAVPHWAAVLLAISQPLHLVFAVIVPNGPLDVAAWCLTAVGFGVAAQVLAGDASARS